MPNRFKNLFESIVYAGISPADRQAQSDPLYLSNQTFGQRARRVILLATPMMVVIAAGLVAIYSHSPQATKAPRELSAQELKAKILPEFNKEIKLNSNQDLEVTEVHFEHTAGHLIAGSLRNKSNHPIVQAMVFFDVADLSNSDLGGVTVTEMNLPAGATRSFRRSIEHSDAVRAAVREVATK